MFGKKKTRDPAAAEARAKERRRKATHLPKGVKQLIGYDAMLRNGIASLGDDRWSATILFHDINYQLSPESHQMEIIDRWVKLINSFEAGQSVQIASYTRSRGVREILSDVMMDERGDSLDHYRLDYNRLAQGKLESVSRDTSTVKTLTVTVQESDEQAAVASLNALCNSLVSQMRSIGCASWPRCSGPARSSGSANAVSSTRPANPTRRTSYARGASTRATPSSWTSNHWSRGSCTAPCGCPACRPN